MDCMEISWNILFMSSNKSNLSVFLAKGIMMLSKEKGCKFVMHFFLSSFRKEDLSKKKSFDPFELEFRQSLSVALK